MRSFDTSQPRHGHFSLLTTLDSKSRASELSCSKDAARVFFMFSLRTLLTRDGVEILTVKTKGKVATFVSILFLKQIWQYFKRNLDRRNKGR